MKARFLALAALVLGLASCQTEPEGLNVNVGGEVDTTITVTIPDTETRAGGNNSAVGVFDNGVLGTEGDDVTMRYIFQVYYNSQESLAEPQVKYSDGKSVNFDIRLVPGRDYTFVVWADVVKKNDQGEWADLHYNTKTNGVINLANITVNESSWVAMDESRDAFTITKVIDEYNGQMGINLELKRALAKLRVVTTDMEALNNLQIKPTYATVTYSTKHYSTFNAVDGSCSGEIANKTHNYFIAPYADHDGKTSKVLFTDYFFAKSQEQEEVNFTLTVYDQQGYDEVANTYTTNDDYIIKTNNFNTPIPARRNYLTTISGNILTDGNNITVEVKDAFENADNTTGAPYYQQAVTNGVELIKALLAGQEIIVLNDITVTAADLAKATRAGNPIYPVINLNGFIITIENNETDALVDLNGGALTVEGEGTIKSTAGALVEGTTVVTEGAAVDAKVAVDKNGQSAVKLGLEALVYICKNGGEFTFVEDLTATEVVLVETTNPVVINGANHTLTSTATRAIRVTPSKANVTINDLNIVVATERVYPNDVRGISLDPDLNGVDLTLNNCSVDFTHKTANDWAYAVNVSGNGTDNKVTVNGGTYNGANVVNAHSAKNTIVVKNATLTSLYPNNDTYYGACIWVLENQGSTVYAEGNTFNGNNAVAFNLGTGTVLEEKNNTDNTKYVAAKVGSVYYYNIAEAIAAAEDGATVKVLQSHDCNVGATVAAGKTLTLDLNGKTVKGTDTITGSFGLITNKGNLTITGNGKMTLKAENNRGWNAYSSVISNTVGGKLVVENGTIEHLGGTDMAYGIDNLTNGKGTYAETVINGGTIKSTYRAIRMFLNGIEAQNLLTVNGGTIEGANKSIWMQDPSANANTGKLVVNEGATLNGDVYLFVCAGSTSWPVEVSIADSAVKGEVLTGNVPEGYVVELINGVWVVNAYTAVESIKDLAERLSKGEAVVMSNSITASAKETPNTGYGAAGITVANGAVLDGNGKTLTINDAWSTWDCAVAATNGTIKNLTVSGAMRGIFMPDATGDVVIDNVVLDNVIYTFNSDAGNKNYGVYISNSTLNGWTSHSDVHKEVVYTNCMFGEGNGYAFCRPYGTTSFVGCDFEAGFEVDAIGKITFENCTIGGVALTAENLGTLVTSGLANASVK